jgi:hypothetical protein
MDKRLKKLAEMRLNKEGQHLESIKQDYSKPSFFEDRRVDMSTPDLRQLRVEHMKEENPELASIAMNESSAGRNIAHATDSKSGMTAAGTYGLMPYTVHDTFNDDIELQVKYPELHEMVKNYKDRHPEITEYINNNPMAGEDIARVLYKRKLNQMGGDRDLTLNSWLYGPGGTKKKVRTLGREKALDNDYMRKHYRNLKQLNKLEKDDK